MGLSNPHLLDSQESPTRPARSDSTKRVDFESVAKLALANGESLLARWLSDGRRRGSEWVARNPTRSDRNLGSFSINIHSGRWADFATGDKGGDLVSLKAYLDRISQRKRPIAFWKSLAAWTDSWALSQLVPGTLVCAVTAKAASCSSSRRATRGSRKPCCGHHRGEVPHGGQSAASKLC